MSRSLLLLVAAMCSASPVFADTVTVTIKSEPAGARVYVMHRPGEEYRERSLAPVEVSHLTTVGFFQQTSDNPICVWFFEIRVEWASGVGANDHYVMFCPEDGPTPSITFTRPEGVQGLEIDVAYAAKIEAIQKPWLNYPGGYGPWLFDQWKNSPEEQARRAQLEQTAAENAARRAENAQALDLAERRLLLWDQYAAQRRANAERVRTLRCESRRVGWTVYTTCE